jgi:phosphonate transport system substrate-binding protein
MRLLRVLSCVVCAFVVAASLSAADKLEKIVVALKPDKNPDAMLEEKKALEAYLSAEVGTKVEVIIPLSGQVIVEGFANGTVDLGYLSGTDLVKARKQNAGDLLLAGEINGNTYYNSYWLVLKDKQYKDITELKGKPVAFASRTSTSGFNIPYWDLVKRGVLKEGEAPEAFFGQGNVFFGTGYVSAVERVLAGDAEAAAVSDYVLDKDKHLKPEQKEKLKLLQKQGPVPTHVIAARNSLPPDVRSKLKASLLALNDKNATLRDKVFTSKLVETDAAKHLESIVEALRLTSLLK